MPVFSITGPFQAGKTTLALRVADNLIQRGLSCGGVLSPGTDERVYVNLLNGAEYPYMAPGEELIEYECRGISKKAIAFGCRALVEGQHADVLFVDEIGKLEASGNGFFSILKTIFHSREGPIVAIIRKDNVPKMAELFGIEVTQTWELGSDLQHEHQEIAKQITSAVLEFLH